MKTETLPDAQLADICREASTDAAVVEVLGVAAEDDGTQHVELHFGFLGGDPVAQTLRAMQRIVQQAKREGLLA